jgi:hypothetical protein
MNLTKQAEIQKAKTTAALTADLAADNLEQRMLALASAVTTAPFAFDAGHVGRLRNAAQVASGAADLIEMELKK